MFYLHKKRQVFVLFSYFYFFHLYFQFFVFMCPAHSFSLVPLYPSTLWLVQPNCWWDAERQDCIPCSCSPHGSMSQRCDIEGRCICRPGFVGRHCDLRRQSYERRETRRPVEHVPIEAVQQRWGGVPRTGGCPRGAYRPKTGVTHTAWCVLSSMGVFTWCAKIVGIRVAENRFKTHFTFVSNIERFVFVDVMVYDPFFLKHCMEKGRCVSHVFYLEFY